MRLTAEIYGYGLPTGKYVLNGLHEDIANKLGQLEDIEEKRGIDIRVLDHALENGAYFKNPYHSGEKIKYFNDLHSFIDLKNNRFDIRMILFVGVSVYSTGGALFPFSEYGKTWALTKEELL